jgi:ATP-binding cassette subfamily B protein
MIAGGTGLGTSFALLTAMSEKTPREPKSFWRELVFIIKRARQVWRLVPHRYKLALAAAALIMALSGVASTAIAVLPGRLIDDMKNGMDRGLSSAAMYALALELLGLIAIAYAAREGMKVLQSNLVESTCTRMEKLMTVRVVSHLMKIDLGNLSHEKIGALHGRISRSTVGFVRLLRLMFISLVPVSITGGLALITALAKQPWLGLIMTGVIPLSVTLTIWQLISQKGVRLTLIRSREDMDGIVVELLSGLDYVRAANTHDHEVTRLATVAEKRRAKETRHLFQMSLFSCAKALNEGLFHILVLGFAVFLATHGRIQFGDILTFSLLFLNVMAPLGEIHRIIDEGHESSLQVRDLLKMLSEPTDPSFVPVNPREPRVELGKPLLYVDGLRVEYTTADGLRRQGLDGISLSLRHGQTIGIAGRSGCGKTTLLRVLMRLTPPTTGLVLVGGVPLESISREAIGNLIGYVGQAPFIFSGTIAENIAYGAKNVTEQDILRAARTAHIHDEIMDMPRGYDAKVAERGSNLSGGQRQRLALARVFLKNPPILILDEGTSALDNISEKNVQQALAEARADRTVIMVAHRLSTLVDTDQIFVFDEGRIVETGTFGELVLRDGAFAELVRSAGGNGNVSPETPRLNGVFPAPVLA